VDSDQASPVAVTSLPPDTAPYWLTHPGHFVEFGTLERPVRRLAWVATVAALAGLMVLTLPLGRLAAVPGLGIWAPIRMPWAVLLVGVGLQIAGWWYLLAGASVSGPAMRWPVVVMFLGFMGIAVPGNLPVAIPLLAVAGYHLWTTFRARALTVNLAVLAGFVALLYALMLRGGAVTLGLTVVNQVTIFYLLFIPFIFYSGFDLGETALHATRLVLLRAHPRLKARRLWWIAVAIAIIKAGLVLRGGVRIGAGILPSLAVIAAGAVLTHWLQPEEDEPPELLALLFSLLIIGSYFGRAVMTLSWSSTAILALAVGAGLIGWRKRRRHLAPVAIFLMIFGFYNLTSAIAFGPGNLLWTVAPGLLPITAKSLDEAVIVAGTAYLVWLRLRGQATVERCLLAVFGLIGFSVVLDTWTFLESLQALSHGLLGLEALLLIIGLAHEIWANGGLLNHGTAGLPRSARVLLYLGYLLLLSSSTVLSDGTSGPTARLINIDALQQAGLLVIGMPLFLQQFLHVFAFGHRSGHLAPPGDGGHALPASDPSVP
jgi:hypothetical protein